LTAPRGVRNARHAGLVGLAMVIGFAGLNAGYARFDSLLGDLVEPRLRAFELSALQIDDWRGRHLAAYSQGQQFFGESSEWDRYLLTAVPGAALFANVPVYLDVITTDDYNTLAAYGVEACYDFHGFSIASIAPVDVGSGVTAEVISYTRTQGTDWTAIWWEWPYRADSGTRFARVTMLIPQGPTATIQHDPANAWISESPRFQATEALLLDLARRVVATQLPAPDEVAGR